MLIDGSTQDLSPLSCLFQERYVGSMFLKPGPDLLSYVGAGLDFLLDWLNRRHDRVGLSLQRRRF